MSTTCNNALETIEYAEYPIVFTPFFGTPVPVKLRKLTQAQIMSCGNFSLIETLEDKISQKGKKIKASDIVAYAQRNHNIVKNALISPTYKQIFEMIGVNPKTKENQEMLDELKIKLRKTKSGPKRSALEEEIDNMKIWCNFLLPNDFISFIVSYTLGINESDINTVSEKMLLEAAILAEKGHDNPADHIDGRFTPFMRDDINKRAWYILHKKRKDK